MEFSSESGVSVSALAWLLEGHIKPAFKVLQIIVTVIVSVQLGAVLLPHGFLLACYYFILDGTYKFFKPDYETALVKGYIRPIIGLRLCKKCTILRYTPVRWRIRHYDNEAQLALSGSEGCWLCHRIYEDLLQSRADRDDPPVFERAEDFPQCYLLLRFAQHTETSSGYLDHLRVKSYIAYIYGRHPRHISPDPSSEASFGIIKEWVERCDTQHSCYQGSHTPLPTRVIDVSGEEPYLFITNGHRARYTTLSHCWGGKQPLITTNATLEERTTIIPKESLPQLYRDAVTVTRRLGIRFLWIDSLCILQDCKEDWSKEAAKMGDVYRLSYLTLYALSAPNCHHGILWPRPSYATESSATAIIPEETREEIFRTAPLSKRAWALQERLLSPRILYYSDVETFWECLTCTAREGNHRIQPYKSTAYRYESYQCFQVRAPLVRPLDSPPSFPVSLPSDWQIIVSEYTRCHLTYRSDKLPALSGLACMYRRNTGYTYAAGMWVENLADELLWFCPVGQKQDNITMKRTHSDPSWSWISTDLAVRFKMLGDAAELRTTDFELIHIGESSPATGEINSPRLTLRAHFYRISLQSEPNPRDCSIYDSGGESFGRGVLDAGDEHPGVPKQCAAILVRRKIQDDLRRRSPRARLYMTYFLIVVSAPDATGEEEWRRIGLAWTTRDIPPAPEMSLVTLV